MTNNTDRGPCLVCDHIESLHLSLSVDHEFVPATEWVDLCCASCNTVIGTVSAPLPDVPVKCQRCSRDTGCASWCPQGHGHHDELFEQDRNCFGPEMTIGLTIEPSPGLGQVANIQVMPRRRFAPPQDSVHVAMVLNTGDADMDLSVSEARQLAAVLLTTADWVDVD
ncbi:DUF6907 domain-containing protein [Nocardia sp. NPDC050412]|uniref:DUF6907 domain-containing protein n=1 Tax=Nocardia sp. NPDC050412 TaxID=3364320 RepID=UPI0037B1142B